MDIDTLRKIQETEKMLRIHSINFSTQEAIENTRNDVMVGGTKVPSFEEVHNIPSNQVLDAKVEAYEENKQSQREVQQMDNQAVNEIKSLKQTIGEQSDLIGKQAQMIYQLQGAVNEIIKEINKIQNSVPTKNPAERQVVLKPEEKKEHPRSGGFKSEDVSVEKFFNFSGSR